MLIVLVDFQLKCIGVAVLNNCRESNHAVLRKTHGLSYSKRRNVFLKMIYFTYFLTSQIHLVTERNSFTIYKPKPAQKEGNALILLGYSLHLKLDVTQNLAVTDNHFFHKVCPLNQILSAKRSNKFLQHPIVLCSSGRIRIDGQARCKFQKSFILHFL